MSVYYVMLKELEKAAAACHNQQLMKEKKNKTKKHQDTFFSNIMWILTPGFS